MRKKNNGKKIRRIGISLFPISMIIFILTIIFFQEYTLGYLIGLVTGAILFFSFLPVIMAGILTEQKQKPSKIITDPGYFWLSFIAMLGLGIAFLAVGIWCFIMNIPHLSIVPLYPSMVYFIFAFFLMKVRKEIEVSTNN